MPSLTFTRAFIAKSPSEPLPSGTYPPAPVKLNVMFTANKLAPLNSDVFVWLFILLELRLEPSHHPLHQNFLRSSVSLTCIPSGPLSPSQGPDSDAGQLQEQLGSGGLEGEGGAVTGA